MKLILTIVFLAVLITQDVSAQRRPKLASLKDEQSLLNLEARERLLDERERSIQVLEEQAALALSGFDGREALLNERQAALDKEQQAMDLRRREFDKREREIDARLVERETGLAAREGKCL